MAQNRYYSSVAFPTYLTSALGASGNPQVASIAGLPSSYPYTMLIDWGLSTQEAISVTSAPTGTGPYTLPCTRGIDGSTAQSHSQNAVVVHGVTAEDYNEPQVHISTGTSGASYPNVIHGLANGSAVVGTTDTQTLSNKTLAGATLTGAITISASATGGLLETVTNTHSTPTAPNIKWVANASADLQLGIFVSGDTVNRFQSDSNGKLQWGAGGASAVDANFYRSSAGTLKTDTAFTVGTTLTTATEVISSGQAAGALMQITNTTSAPSAPNVQYVANAAADATTGIKVTGDTQFRLTVDSNGKMSWSSGSAVSDVNLYRSAANIISTDNSFTATTGMQVGGTTTTYGSGSGGILGITNASTPPSAASISGGLAVFAQSGLLRYMNANGLSQVITGSQLGGTVTYANATAETALATLTVPANDPIAGAVYFMQGFGVVSTTGSPTLTWKTRWGGTSGTSLATTAALTQGTGVTTLPFFFTIQVLFTSTTQCIASMNLGYFTAAGTVPTINYQQGTAVSTVTTNASEALVFTGTWSAASSSNTLTTWYSAERIS